MARLVRLGRHHLPLPVLIVLIDSHTVTRFCSRSTLSHRSPHISPAARSEARRASRAAEEPACAVEHVGVGHPCKCSAPTRQSSAHSKPRPTASHPRSSTKPRRTPSRPPATDPIHGSSALAPRSPCLVRRGALVFLRIGYVSRKSHSLPRTHLIAESFPLSIPSSKSVYGPSKFCSANLASTRRRPVRAIF